MKAREFAGNSSVRFGTSGLRGLAAELSDAVCFAYVSAFLRMLGTSSGDEVALGMDLRPSSPGIASACAAAIHHHGARIDFCGRLSTPALAFYSARKRIPAVMVTGSHIPFDRNGIKFYRAEGEISKEDEAAIGETEIAVPEALAPVCLGSPNPDAATVYIERYLSFFPQDALSGMKIGFYQHSSVAREALTEILERLGATVTPLGRTDAFVPVDTEAVSPDDIARARGWAREGGFDALISTDGDADRPLIADQHGNWLRGDVVGILCASFFRADAVVTTVNCTTALEKCGRFPCVRRTRIGSPYVIEGIKSCLEEGYRRVVGFEPNGGFMLGSDIERDGCFMGALLTRDAVLPILCALAMARSSGAGLPECLERLPPRFTASGRLAACPVEKSGVVLSRLKTHQGAVENLFGKIGGRPLHQNETDGLRISFENGEIIHLRPSGNAPEFRIYAEAASQARADMLVRAALAAVEENLS
ncbi:MAG: phosphomannomutase [Candidatus Accumulibacter sp.]|jgi:phosphomannomutase|nr:phosphomannomutase [Accumulibacter sp.]